MKKLIALVLTIVMMAAISLPAFAADLPTAAEHYGANNSLTDGQNEGLVEVHYKVESAYEICIPENVVFEDTYGYKFTADVAAKNVIIGKSQTLTINLASANGFKMMPVGEGNVDGVLYNVVYSKNVSYDAFDWPEVPKGDNSNMSTKLEEKLGEGYTEAAANTSNAVVVVQGGRKQTVTTTMMFFLPSVETTLGHYIDTLTFSVDVSGTIDTGANS